MSFSKHLRSVTVYLSVLALVLVGFTLPEEENSDNSDGIAVVELFTSQGCSSCPAADANLSQIINQNSDRNVYGLSFHVSYWNYLGWKDPYSKEEYTQRQRDYGAHFRNSSIYTPQMVVNGSQEFVGSDKSASTRIIQKALLKQSTHNIEIETELSKNEIIVTYEITGVKENVVLNVALVERDLKNIIPRGENRNKTLHHDNVVRAFRTLEIAQNGELKFKLPHDFNADKGSVIAYVQDKTSKVITGASASRINQ